MEAILAGSTFSKETYRAAAAKFVSEYQTAAGQPDETLGHWVGMATHDDGPYARPRLALRPFHP